MIKYIGSKRALLGHVTTAIASALPDGGTVCDLFSGTARVGHALKRQGFQVWSNDHNAYAHILATAYVQADRDRWLARAEAVLADLRAVKPEPGWFTRAFCEDARYFTPQNGARIDAMRDRVAALSLEPELEAVALVSLMEAADRVDSTAGVQMAYMKRWAPRALKPLELRLPDLLPGRGRATRRDAVELAPEIEADLVYLDPPYNQHSYLGNYHCWESLVLWDKPETYGVANKRIDVRTRKSAFNSRPGIGPALQSVIETVKAPNLVVSFNDEGYLSREQLTDMLSARGEVRVIEIQHPRYVGARIGIHNPKGEKVGSVGRLRNVEYLFVVSDRRLNLADAA
jgi:adenine-specific DNA-methyltransferase